MAELIVVLWRDIPAQVIARRSRREQVKRVLAPRFAEAIDKAAMRGDARDADSYLQEWHKRAPEPCDENLEQAAETRALLLEEAYNDERLAALVANGGAEQESPKESHQESHQESPQESPQESHQESPQESHQESRKE